jgi:hypothetical protein
MPESIYTALKEDFNIPENQLDLPLLSEVLAKVKALEEVKEKASEALFWVSTRPVKRGGLVDMVGRRIPFPEGKAYELCTIVFIDPTPTAAWAHPSWWAFVPENASKPVIIPAIYPEHPKSHVSFQLCE